MTAVNETTQQRQNEIITLNRTLEQFDIRFAGLADRSSGAAAQTLLEISKSLAQNEELLSELNSKRKLPVQSLLLRHAGVTRKMLRDHHQFIVTMALILSGPYPFLRAYMNA